MATLTLRGLNAMSQMSLNRVLSKHDFALLNGQKVQTRKFVSRTLQFYLVFKSWLLFHQTKAEPNTTEEKTVFCLG